VILIDILLTRSWGMPDLRMVFTVSIVSLLSSFFRSKMTEVLWVLARSSNCRREGTLWFPAVFFSCSESWETEQNGSVWKEDIHCHALVLVFCVFFIILVRPGCDMGLLCGVFCLGCFSRYRDCGLVGLSRKVYGCLRRFSIRGRWLSLSLIGNHI
jgi:hypothetical protein